MFISCAFTYNPSLSFQTSIEFSNNEFLLKFIPVQHVACTRVRVHCTLLMYFARSRESLIFVL